MAEFGIDGKVKSCTSGAYRVLICFGVICTEIWVFEILEKIRLRRRTSSESLASTNQVNKLNSE